MIFTLGDTIHYMKGGKICSGKVLARMVVENISPDSFSIFFGPSGAEYATADERITDKEAFGSKYDLIQNYFDLSDEDSVKINELIKKYS